jgi:hypothetical protein
MTKISALSGISYGKNNALDGAVYSNPAAGTEFAALYPGRK